MNSQNHEDLLRQRNALLTLNDEIMSILHAQQLRGPQVQSAQVVAWMHGLYDTVMDGLGKPVHFSQASEA